MVDAWRICSPVVVVVDSSSEMSEYAGDDAVAGTSDGIIDDGGSGSGLGAFERFLLVFRSFLPFVHDASATVAMDDGGEGEKPFLCSMETDGICRDE